MKYIDDEVLPIDRCALISRQNLRCVEGGDDRIAEQRAQVDGIVEDEVELVREHEVRCDEREARDEVRCKVEVAHCEGVQTARAVLTAATQGVTDTHTCHIWHGLLWESALPIPMRSYKAECRATQRQETRRD